MASRQPVDTAEYRRRQWQDSGSRSKALLEIARGSALECAAIQDVLVVGKALDKAESQERKAELDRIAAMLSRLGGRGYAVREDPHAYGDERIDFDSDSDFDPDKRESQQADSADS